MTSAWCAHLISGGWQILVRPIRIYGTFMQVAQVRGLGHISYLHASVIFYCLTWFFLYIRVCVPWQNLLIFLRICDIWLWFFFCWFLFCLVVFVPCSCELKIIVSHKAFLRMCMGRWECWEKRGDCNSLRDICFLLSFHPYPNIVYLWFTD